MIQSKQISSTKYHACSRVLIANCPCWACALAVQFTMQLDGHSSQRLLPMEKQANIIYKIPCTCRKLYIGKTKHWVETHLKEHKDVSIKDRSAIALTEDHPIHWDDYWNTLVETWSELVVNQRACTSIVTVATIGGARAGCVHLTTL